MTEEIDKRLMTEAASFDAHVYEAGIALGVDEGTAECVARIACGAWLKGYEVAVKTITAKVRTMCNQRQILEYLEGIKL